MCSEEKMNCQGGTSTAVRASNGDRGRGAGAVHPPVDRHVPGAVVLLLLEVHRSTKAPVTLANGSTSHTCPPALGYSFAAGTTDGPGEFDFTQVSDST